MHQISNRNDCSRAVVISSIRLFLCLIVVTPNKTNAPLPIECSQSESQTSFCEFGPSSVCLWCVKMMWLTNALSFCFTIVFSSLKSRINDQCETRNRQGQKSGFPIHVGTDVSDPLFVNKKVARVSAEKPTSCLRLRG